MEASRRKIIIPGQGNGNSKRRMLGPSGIQVSKSKHLLVPPWTSQMMPNFHRALPTLATVLIFKKKKKIFFSIEMAIAF